VIIDPNGTIITNNHVVQNAIKVQVRLNDHRSLTAKVLGTDPLTDLAVIKVDANNLTPIVLADSSKVEVGQWVMAVGNPLGYSGTLSVGVISSLNRDLQTDASFLTDAIQTDAAINEGNSGGALTDAQGRLIGINSAIASNTGGGSIGIGFAIPVNRAKRVAKEIIQYGHAVHAGLPVEFFSRFDGALENADMRGRLTEAYGVQVPDHGVIIRRVQGGSSAEQAGMREYDILLAINGNPVHREVDVYEALTDLRPGDSVAIQFWSKGSVKDEKLKLQEVVAQ
jgi:S1-C subfamily serine protease